MGVLSTTQRSNLAPSQFAGPGRSFPVNDKDHAEKALQLVGRSVSAGNISEGTADKIRAKARTKLKSPQGYGAKIMDAMKGTGKR